MQKISVGGYHTLCVDKSGSIWAFGYNYYGQLGLGDTTERTTPTKLSWITHPKSVACGYVHSMVLDSSGELWSFGYNGDGELGLGDTMDRSQPTQVTSMKNVQILTEFQGRSQQKRVQTWKDIHQQTLE